MYTYVLTRTNKGGFTFRDGRNPVFIFGVDLSETEREKIDDVTVLNIDIPIINFKGIQFL